MNNIDEYLGIMTIGLVLAATLQLYLLRRQINNFADPLFYFVLTSAFSLGLGVHAVDSVELYVRIVFYFLCLYIGFFSAIGKPKIAAQPLVMHFGVGQFKSVVVIGGTLYLIANLAVWAKSGLIILSSDPTLYKSTSYDGGLGIVRRINWGLGSFVLIAATYWYLWERSKTALVWLGLAVLISISGGSKSALLPIIFAMGLYFLNPFSPASSGKKMPNPRSLVYAALFAIIPVVTVLLIEQGSLETAATALLQRLFFFGDILLYWGQPDLRAHFVYLGLLDYLRDSFGSILGMLRLIDYGIPMGNQFVQFTLPVGTDFSESLGPNLPFYVRGELYLGVWIAPVHAFVVGWILGRIRRIFAQYRGANLLHYTLAAFAIMLSTALPGEEVLAIGEAFDFMMIFTPIYVLVLLISFAAQPSRAQFGALKIGGGEVCKNENV